MVSQFAEIIDLAVEGQYVTIVSIHHRLMTAGTEINDAEPVVADCKAGARLDKSSRIVWPSMSHRRHQPIKRRQLESSSRIHQPAPYRTHYQIALCIDSTMAASARLDGRARRRTWRKD